MEREGKLGEFGVIKGYKMGKRYRPNVAAVVLSSNYPEKVEVLICKRNDQSGAWQFPQGGIDEGEDYREALFRELKEEIGTDEVEVIAEMDQLLRYDFPPRVAQKMYPYDGQEQRYFLVKLKPGAKIDIKTASPEFSDYKFVPLEQLFDQVWHLKMPIYKKVIDYFRKEGYL